MIFDNQTKLNESLDNRCNNRVLQVKLEKSTILVFGITYETTVLNNAGDIMLLIMLDQLHTFFSSTFLYTKLLTILSSVFLYKFKIGLLSANFDRFLVPSLPRVPGSIH